MKVSDICVGVLKIPECKNHCTDLDETYTTDMPEGPKCFGGSGQVPRLSRGGTLKLLRLMDISP